MKLLLFMCILAPTVALSSTETVISCENGRLKVSKECHMQGDSPSAYVCKYNLSINDGFIIEQVFMDVDISTVNFDVLPQEGWGNFDSQFATIGTENRNSYMKVTLSQNGHWEELNLKTYTHYIGGNPYYYADWTFRHCKSLADY